MVHVLQSTELSGTDATDITYLHNASENTVEVESVSLVPNIAVTANDTNYITVAVKKGIGGTAIATAKTTQITGGAAHVAGTPQSFTLSGTGSTLLIDPGGVIEVSVAKAGTGPAYAFTVAARVRDVRVAA
jgi:hypothetical protein